MILYYMKGKGEKFINIIRAYEIANGYHIKMIGEYCLTIFRGKEKNDKGFAISTQIL